MDMNQLLQFQTAAKYENLTKAAAELYITQSALSKNIRQLESELQTPLFDRNGKSITLNPAGKIVLKYTKHLLEITDLMGKALRKESGAKETVLNLATNRPTIAHNLFPQIMIQHPELTLNTKLIEMDGNIAAQLLISGIYDLLITNFPIYNDEIVSILHSEEKLGLCVTTDSPLAVHSTIHKEDLNGLVLPSTPYSHNTILKELAEELKKSDIVFSTFMVPDITTVNYLMKISDIPSIFTDVAWSFNRLPNRVLIEIEGIPHRENYIHYLRKNEADTAGLIYLLTEEYRTFSDD